MILVTGATGTIGSEVVRGLVKRGVAVRATTRDPSRVTMPSDVEVVRADFGDPPSLRSAASGVTTLFLLSAAGPTLPEHDLAMIDAAREAGVRKVVMLSAIRTDEMERFRGGLLGSWHRPGEQAVRDSGMAWTVLRPTSFASNSLQWAGAIRAGEPIPNAMGAGRQGIIDPRDVSAVAVETLVSPGHDGAVHTLTGPDLLTVEDQAEALTRVLRRAVTTVDTPPERMREQLLGSGVDPAYVEVFVAGADLVRAGGNAVVTDTVERVLGRRPGGYEAWAADHRADFLG